jgi:pullulanase/glycogen debranching enzyme
VDTETKLSLAPYNPLPFAKKAAYFQRRDEVVFLLPESRVKFLNTAKDPIFLAADFNNWYDATKSPNFALKFTTINGENFFALSLPISSLPNKADFKFVSSSGTWFDPEIDAPNKKCSDTCSVNYLFDKTKTGQHLLILAPQEPLVLANKFSLKVGEQIRSIDVSPWLLTCYIDAELGAKVQNKKTSFRVFIPRAHSARVLVYKNPRDTPIAIPMRREHDNTWTAEKNADLHGQFYHYQALFYDETNWDKAPKILDPYAKATCSRSGPGVILNEHTFLPLRNNFVSHPMKNDVILEVHVRDLLKNAPLNLGPEQRLGFNGLSKWLRKRHCYLRDLGTNTIEFQPITESDAGSKNEYHWGYMPVNYFSPASAYSSSPIKAPMEFKKLVRACHRARLAVILDVVCNHVGEQSNLLNIDPDYFFRKNGDGSLQNCSGCGNDLRTESPMVKRLIIDSLIHFIKTYNVDGFRFDLAELLGMEFLYQLERELRLVKNDVQIIYEPWSFRGNIGQKLQNFSGSAWNDEYRDFLANYVCGNGNFDGIKYFLGGSLGFRSAFMHQSVNYVESHDDLCWIDKITENWHHNGTNCTDNDRKRTHLALAILMMSLGIPMLHAGQDILQSKRGIKNTYKLGGVNALDYGLLAKNRSTHKFFKRWIRFRLSKPGSVLRSPFTLSEKYLKFFHSTGTSAVGVLYNADFSLRSKRVFFAVNPHLNSRCSIDIDGFDLSLFRQLSDENKFFTFSKKLDAKNLGKTITLEPLSLMLCIE